MMGGTHDGRCEVVNPETDPGIDGSRTATVRYRKIPEGSHGQDPGWYVKTPADDNWWQFAGLEANERTIRVLIFKEWCDKWTGQPARFSGHD